MDFTRTYVDDLKKLLELTGIPSVSNPEDVLTGIAEILEALQHVNTSGLTSDELATIQFAREFIAANGVHTEGI